MFGRTSISHLNFICGRITGNCKVTYEAGRENGEILCECFSGNACFQNYFYKWKHVCACNVLHYNQL